MGLLKTVKNSQYISVKAESMFVLFHVFRNKEKARRCCLITTVSWLFRYGGCCI
jgi:hypothetical protein